MSRSNRHRREHDRTIRDRLAERGARFTAGRRAVVEELEQAPGPLTAADLGEVLRGRVPVSSLYRTLTVLDDAGVVETHHGPGGVTRYELAEWLSGHHHHVRCERCGAMEDVLLSEAQERALDSVAHSFDLPEGFRATGHSVDVHGICGRCVP